MNRLKDLDAVEVSLVPRGANRKKFLIFKEDDTAMEEILKAVLETELEDEQKVEEVLKAAKLSGKAQNAVKGALRLLNAYKDELPKDIMKTLAGLAGYGYPAPTEKQKDKKDEDEEDKKKKYGYPAPTKKEDGSYDFSGIPEEVRPAVEALWKEQQEAVKKAEELEKILKEERDKQLRKEFIQKAADEFANLPTKPEEFGLVLKGLAEKAPEEYTKLEGVLKAANEAIEKGALYAEIGRGGTPAGDSAVAKVEAMAAGLVQKDANLSRMDALAKVLAENPQLYEQYRKETAVRI
ncbi:MAG: hypothetical protein JRD89_04135 [Deltaproteobacteria bacterium]|nr:hypothetical protein [Deltaproteobacteria bacterium]